MCNDQACEDCVGVADTGQVCGGPDCWCSARTALSLAENWSPHTGHHPCLGWGGGGTATATMVKVDWRYVRLYHNQMNNNNKYDCTEISQDLLVPANLLCLVRVCNSVYRSIELEVQARHFQCSTNKAATEHLL